MVVGLLVASVGLAPRAGADDGGRPSRVSGAIEFADPVVSPLSCDAALHCVVGLSATNQWSGGLQGTSSSREIIAVDQTTGWATFESFELFTGHVQGCGDGSFTMRGSISRSFPSPGTGTLEVLPGTGSGDLAGVRGRGTFSVTPTGPTSATSTFVLDLRCRD
jgi:hypothetical protein